MKLCTVFRTLLTGCVAFYSTCTYAADTPAAANTPEPADLIIYNAKIITVNPDFTEAQAVAIRGDQIVAVGKEEQLTAYKGINTQLIDAQQRTIMPGLYDNHVHSYNAAVSELNNPVPALDSIAAAQEYIRKQAAKKPAGSWIILEGLYPSRLKEGRLPTKAELDDAATNNPVYWNFGSLSVVNSKALQISKITNGIADPPGGEVVKEPRHLKPTGVLRNASSLLKLPPAPHAPTPQQERTALKHLYQLYNQQGITSIGEQDTTPKIIDAFRDLSRSNELTVRINCARHFEVGATYDDNVTLLDALTNTPGSKLSYGPTGAGDDWVRIGPLETTLDGDILMATAYMRTPWGIGPTYGIAEPAYRGELQQDPYLLPQVYLEAVQRGWQLRTHCAGDAAMDFLLKCFEEVQFKTNITERRFSASLATFQAPQNWERLQKLGIAADMQPAWLYHDGSTLEKLLGEKRLKYFLPFKSWFDKGLVVGAGSDHRAGLDSINALNPWNPWLGIWIAVTRETEQGPVINPDEQITREQAIRLYTYNNAWLNFEEKKKGSIEAGKYADLIVVDTDILNCPVDDIPNTKVLLTMVGGKIVFGANQLILASPEITATPTSTNETSPTSPLLTSTNTAVTRIITTSVTNIVTTTVVTNITTSVVGTNGSPALATTNITVSVTTNATDGANLAAATAPSTSTNATSVTTDVPAASTTNETTAVAANAATATNTPSATTPTVANTPASTNATPSAPTTIANASAAAGGPITDPFEWSRPAILAQPGQSPAPR